MRDHAQAAAADGWPVGPLRSGDKRPVPGVDSWAFTTDPAAIDAWGWRWEGANLGGRCGEGYVAIDVDPAEGSEQTIADLADQGFELPATRTHGTPSGGRHPVYLAPLGSRGGKLGDGLMVRGWGERGGSYIVLPPSVLYVYHRPPGAARAERVELGRYVVLDDRPPVEAPDWLVARAIPHPASSSPPAVWDGPVPTPEPVDLAELPWYLADLLDQAPRSAGETRDGRSAQLWRLVATSLEWGLTDGQVLALGRLHQPSLAKYDGRLDGEVARCLAKLRPRHQHVGSPCDHAGCPRAPSWMGGRAG